MVIVLVHGEWADSFTGDMIELYDRRRVEGGRFLAFWWLIWQVLHLLLGTVRLTRVKIAAWFDWLRSRGLASLRNPQSCRLTFRHGLTAAGLVAVTAAVCWVASPSMNLFARSVMASLALLVEGKTPHDDPQRSDATKTPGGLSLPNQMSPPGVSALDDALRDLMAQQSTVDTEPMLSVMWISTPIMAAHDPEPLISTLFSDNLRASTVEIATYSTDLDPLIPEFIRVPGLTSTTLYFSPSLPGSEASTDEVLLLPSSPTTSLLAIKIARQLNEEEEHLIFDDAATGAEPEPKPTTFTNNIAVTASVPEPATTVLIGLGLFALVVMAALRHLRRSRQ